MYKRHVTIHTLENGLRLVHLQIGGSPVEHFGIAVGAGSSDESTDQYGLAHFVEHTLFKGTEKRNSWHIINRMESVGGELNAFTTKEDTVIYSTFPRGSLRRAVELISDLMLNSRFPDAEIEKERCVVCDEINSYLDSPADAVYDDFEDLLYKGNPLGHNILGTEDSVNRITGADCRKWMESLYFAGNMVAFYAGSQSAQSVVSKCAVYLCDIPRKHHDHLDVPEWKSNEVFSVTQKSATHQAHTVLGCCLPCLEKRERLVFALLTNILGGPGMNSLLNVSLRERRGLVYNVESSLSNWRRTSMFSTYFGTDPEDNNKCIDLVVKEMKSLAQGSMTPRKLGAFIKQYRGQLILSQANVENRVMGIARALLLHGQVNTLEETNRMLDGITVGDITSAAERLLPLSSLTFI